MSTPQNNTSSQTATGPDLKTAATTTLKSAANMVRKIQSFTPLAPAWYAVNGQPNKGRAKIEHQIKNIDDAGKNLIESFHALRKAIHERSASTETGTFGEDENSIQMRPMSHR